MIRFAAALAATTAVALASAASAQDHSMHNMPGMTMPAPVKKAPAKKAAPSKAAPKKAGPAKPAARKTVPSPRRAAAKPAASSVAPAIPEMPGMDHSAHSAALNAASPAAHPMDHSMHGQPARTGQMDHGAMPEMTANDGPMQGMDHGAMPGTQMPPVGTALPAGNAPAPPPPMDHYADRQFSKDEMERSRDEMMRESGGKSFYQVMFNLAEYQARKGRDGYRWDGEAWFGGDINRVTLKSEGAGAFREGVESAEIQALYSHAIGPYFNLQAGVRHDFEPGRPTNYATVGFEGLAPYWFEVEGALFLSDKGDLLGRLEGYYDQRITQRFVLQPRVEFNFAAQDVPATRIGAGLSSAELGLRLRYDISRKFAPYVGVSYEAKSGQTARYARADGEDTTVTSLVAGIRLWF